jgi:archaellum biogenesis ATPase FlaH
VIEFIEPPENPESVKQSLLSLASNNLRDKKEMALFIDSLAALARHLGVANTSWILQTLTESGAFLVVLADDYSLRLKLSSLADMRIKLDMLAITPNSRNTLFINVNTRKKGVFEEKVIKIVLHCDILTSYSISSHTP